MHGNHLVDPELHATLELFPTFDFSADSLDSVRKAFHRS